MQLHGLRGDAEIPLVITDGFCYLGRRINEFSFLFFELSNNHLALANRLEVCSLSSYREVERHVIICVLH